MNAWLDAVAPVLARLAVRGSMPVRVPAQDVGALDLGQPRPRAEALDLCAQLLEGGLRGTHPRALGWFTPAPLEAAAVADLLVSWVNPQLAVRAASPGPVAVEERLAADLAGFFGLGPGAGGVFTAGGSEATHTAALLALSRGVPGFEDRGVRASEALPTLYASTEAHRSLEKIAIATGLGRDALVTVPCDAQLRLDVRALERQLEADRRRGRLPVMVVGTAGTTNVGAIDPLPELAALSARHRLWFHVDAAWGGAAALSAGLRPLLAGVEQADSVTFDPHKGLSMPLGTGLLLVREAGRLRSVFAPRAPYVLPPEVPADPYCASLSWSRRFIGLRLLLPLLEEGWAGFARRFEEQVRLGRWLSGQLVERGWELVFASPLAIVCFADPRNPSAAHHQAIARTLDDTGRAFVAATQVAGRPALRACIGNATTTQADLQAVLEALDDARRAAEEG